ncbi:MAG: YARHG domain-containing protein [Chitinophagaceae bacterium]
MRKYSTLICLAVLLAGCADHKKASEEVKQVSAQLVRKILGSFVGAFGDNRITLLITRAEGQVVEGRSIVGGNDRPFKGTLQEKDGAYLITAREPGDDPNDGTFAFTIDPEHPDLVSGSWKPLQGNSPSKDYTLRRKAFTYRTDVGEYPQASARELVPEDVENLMKDELETMRNEIFARHGYCFKRKEMRQYFESEDWYVPDNVDVRSKLTAVEKKNIELIKRYEQYAEEYGDEFGR